MALKSDNIFVNLPVKDLEKTKDFFSKIGFEFNAQFTDKNAACLVIGDNIFAMSLTEDYFKTFTKKDLSNAANTTEVILALSAESREQVDEIVNAALSAGGSPPMIRWIMALCTDGASRIRTDTCGKSCIWIRARSNRSIATSRCIFNMKQHTSRKMKRQRSPRLWGNLPLYFYLEIRYICMCKQLKVIQQDELSERGSRYVKYVYQGMSLLHSQSS